MDNTSRKILIAEDEIIIALDITSTLQLEGYRYIHRVSSGEMMVQKFRSENPDLIITDIMLKGKINGIEAARLIKKQKDIPIIFIAGFSDKNYIKDASLISPNNLIHKPFDTCQLRDKVRLLLENYS